MEALHDHLYPVQRRELERSQAIARTHLDPQAWETAWTEGRAMTLEQAVAYALAPEPEPLVQPAHQVPQPAATPAHRAAVPAKSYPAGLTAREVEVLRLVAQGLTNEQVAERLIISPRTVEKHLESIYGKLQVTSRAAATRFAIEHQLL